MRHRSVLIAFFLWVLLCVSGVILSHGTVSLTRPAMTGMSPGMQVGLSSVAIVVQLIASAIAGGSVHLGGL